MRVLIIFMTGVALVWLINFAARRMERRSYFFYEGSWNYRRIWYLFTFLTVLFFYFLKEKLGETSFSDLGMVDVLFNLTLALWGSYFVTLLFHLCTTVVTEKAKDQAALECLKSMAKCRIFIQEMKSTPEKIYPGRIQELKDLLYMVLNNRTIIIASAKPGLLPVIEACIPDYRELEKQLRIIDHGLPDLVDLSRLESMDRVHDMLLSQGQSSFAKTYPDTSFPEFADGKRLAKAYERLYADAEKFVRTPQGEKQPGPNKPLKMDGRHAAGPRRNLEADRMSTKSPFKNQDALLDFYLIADALLHLSATLPEDCGGLSCLLRLLGERLESLTVAMDK